MHPVRTFRADDRTPAAVAHALPKKVIVKRSAALEVRTVCDTLRDGFAIQLPGGIDEHFQMMQRRGGDIHMVGRLLNF